MKSLLFFSLISLLFFSSCRTVPYNGPSSNIVTGVDIQPNFPSDPGIEKSLFVNEKSTISEENIQKILNGKYELPDSLNVSFVQLESKRQRGFFWNDEWYLNSKQAFFDYLSTEFKKSARVEKIRMIPDILLNEEPNFTNIREAAVRTQSDIVAIYSISSNLYANHKLFSKTDIKAFSTSQLIILDVRTGLIPFTKMSTKEYQSKRMDDEMNDREAIERVKKEAVLLALNDISEDLQKFLNQ